MPYDCDKLSSIKYLNFDYQYDDNDRHLSFSYKSETCSKDAILCEELKLLSYTGMTKYDTHVVSIGFEIDGKQGLIGSQKYLETYVSTSSTEDASLTSLTTLVPLNVHRDIFNHRCEKGLRESRVFKSELLAIPTNYLQRVFSAFSENLESN